jgi:hypothetical protein
MEKLLNEGDVLQDIGECMRLLNRAAIALQELSGKDDRHRLETLLILECVNVLGDISASLISHRRKQYRDKQTDV